MGGSICFYQFQFGKKSSKIQFIKIKLSENPAALINLIKINYKLPKDTIRYKDHSIY